MSIKLKEGDVFSWSFKNIDRMGDDPYWHCSQICETSVTSDGEVFLYDTYWGDAFRDSRFPSHDLDRVDLVFLGNLSDYNHCSYADRAFFDDSEFLSLNHCNNTTGNLFIKKSAKKSIKKMRVVARRIVNNNKSKASHYQDKYEESLKQLHDLKIDSTIYLDVAVSLNDEYEDEQ